MSRYALVAFLILFGITQSFDITYIPGWVVGIAAWLAAAAYIGDGLNKKNDSSI